MAKAKSNEMPDLYRIKFWFKSNPNIVRYGEVERYSDEAKQAWKNGHKLVVADALTGNLFLVEYDHPEIVIEEQPLGWSKNDPETHMSIDTDYDRYLNDEFKKALKLHKRAGKGIKVDKLCYVGVADGYACYIITKVNAKTCKVEWRAFGGADNRVDRRWGYERTVPHNEAKMYVYDELVLR